MDYEKAYVLAAIRARTRKQNWAVMKTAFRDFTIFPASDVSDYHKYEIVYPDSPIVLV
jgi:hypothetical protein